jgi:hypothetical protein
MSTSRKRRAGRATVAAGAGLALYLLLRRGRGWRPTRRARHQAGAPARCRLHLGAAGLTLNGAATDLERAVAACKASGRRAELTVSGDAIWGEREELLRALAEAGIPTSQGLR